jgi:hypothetical protein
MFASRSFIVNAFSQHFQQVLESILHARSKTGKNLHFCIGGDDLLH